jgi:hypothetical protein
VVGAMDHIRKGSREAPRLSTLGTACTLILWVVLLGAGVPLASDRCPQGPSAMRILDTGVSTALARGYAEDEFMELLGPMHWGTLAQSKFVPSAVLGTLVERGKSQAQDRCVWLVYLGCEPPHHTEAGGFTGCLDRPPQIWILIDSETGGVVHTVRYTGRDARMRINE